MLLASLNASRDVIAAARAAEEQIIPSHSAEPDQVELTGTTADIPVLESRVADSTAKMRKNPHDAQAYFARGKSQFELSIFRTSDDRYAMRMSAIQDLETANSLAGGDPVRDPKTNAILSREQLTNWPANPEGVLESLPNIRRTSSGELLKTGTETPIGGPGHFNAMLKAAGIAANLYNFPLALKYADRAMTIDPTDDIARAYTVYLSALIDGSYQDAAREIRGLQDDADADDLPKIHTLLAQTYRKMNRRDLAEKHFRKALEVKPTDRVARSGLGVTLSELQRFDEAIEIHKKLLTANPNDHFTAVNLASAYNRAERYAEARDVCTKLVKMEPGFPAAWLNLGKACWFLRDDEGALLAYRRVTELIPIHSTAHYYVGRALQNLGRYEEAEPAYIRAIQLDPSYASAYYQLGRNCNDQKQYKRAVEYLKSYTAMNSKRDYGWSSLAYSLYMLERYDESQEAYQRALTVNPQHGYSLSGLGFICERKGDDKGAAEYHKLACLAKEPRTRSLHDYKRVTFRNAWFDMVADDMLTLAGNEEWEAAAYDLRTLACIARGNESEALKDYRNVASVIDADAKGALHHLTGVIHFLAGDDVSAVDELQAAILWDKNQPYAALHKWLAEKRLHREKDAEATLVSAMESTKKGSSLDRLLAYLKNGGKESTLIEAAESDGERCEAYYYIAQKLLLEGKKDEATARLRECTQTGAFHDLEYAFAYHTLNKKDATDKE